MSSKKYVLDPSGKIKDVATGNDINPENVTDQYMQQQGDFFGDRADFAAGAAKIPATNFLPSGVKGLAAAGADLIGSSLSNNLKETGIIARETPVKTDGLFPDSNRDTLLVNPSFGADEDTKYYKNFNTAFSEFNANKNIFAEELEMVAGIEFNSLGLASVKGLDITKLLFVFDYILESAAYIATAVSLLELNNHAEQLKTSPIIRYFHDILQFNYKNKKRNPTIRNVDHMLMFFIVGLDQFINTDPKDKSVLDSKFNKLFQIGFTDTSIFELSKLISNIILSFSKIGNNRLFLLIRKFQQESYWHSEILYNAKDSNFAGIGITAENAIDRFFAEFSQYYFKFIVERINVGHMIYRSDRSAARTKNRKIYGSRRHENFRALPGYKDTTEQLSASGSGTLYGDYSWDAKKTETSSIGNLKSSTTSILSLPQLLKGYDYDIHRMKNAKIQQNFKSTKKEERRFSPDLVRKIEDHLETEYMPFYFHDLRTNEILSFHAFIDTISDSFSPNYNSTKGYGRIDDVKHYMDTTRSISTTFKLISYNEDDHDMMWYQINKLVAMVYPQWSEGISSIREDNPFGEDFRFPFTQMPTASPLIRLRVGDVIKSNYSVSSLAKLHGNKKEIEKKVETTAVQEQKYSHTELYHVLAEETPVFVYDDDNKTFVEWNNQQEFEIYLQRLLPSMGSIFTEELRKIPLKNSSSLNILKQIDATTPTITYPKDTLINGESIEYPTLAFDFVRIRKTEKIYHYIKRSSIYAGAPARQGTSAAAAPLPLTEVQKFSTITTESQSISFPIADTVSNDVIKSTEGLSKINNPFTKAYESSRGRGLAGFITNLDVNYNEVTWETLKIGGKAPTMVTITISFAPIHDIPPGLDHEGILRAPVYNVGNINNAMFGDVYDESGKEVNNARGTITDLLNKMITKG